MERQIYTKILNLRERTKGYFYVDEKFAVKLAYMKQTSSEVSNFSSSNDNTAPQWSLSSSTTNDRN
jgi:hypothetical protein